MFIISYYVFLAVYSILFGHLFQLDFSNLTNPWLYILTLIALLLGAVISLITQVLIFHVVGLLRENKGYTDLFNHKFANSLFSFGVHLMRVKLIVTGRENIPKTNFILVGNHQENWDPLILKPIFKDHALSFIAKAAIIKLPVFGRWIKLAGGVFISKTADRSAAESIIKAIKNYKSGMSMGIFPEGKRDFGNELIEFKPGAFKLAMKPKADILIATQYDTCTIFKKFPWKRYRVYVHVHPLLKYEEYEGMKSQELSAMVKERIQKQIDIFKKDVK